MSQSSSRNVRAPLAQASARPRGPLRTPARRGWAAAAGIVALAFLAYLPALRSGFFWDDFTYLANNPLIEAPDGLRRIWLTTEPPEYLPLTYSSHWLERRLWGGAPAGPHAVNVLLHAASALLLWRVLRRLRVPGAWLAGMLFAVHPVAAASAAWIMERKNTLSMVLCLASLLAFLRFDEEAERGRLGDSEIRRLGDSGIPRPLNLPISQSPNFPISPSPSYLLSVVLFLLALLAKTSVVMLPAVLLLCAWWRRGRICRKDLLRSVPFFALSLALGLVTVWFQQHNAIQGQAVRPEGAASRIAAAGWIAWFYLYKLLLPAGLCVIYPRWNVDGSSLRAFLPLLLLLGGMALLWARRKSWGRAPLFAFGYFLIMLLPVLGFLDMAFMRLSLVADHLQYAAMIGVISLAASLLAPKARASGGLARPGGRPRQRRAAAAAGCAALLACLTCARASLYAGGGAPLWRDNLAKNPSDIAAWTAWRQLGDIRARAEDYEGALGCYRRAIGRDAKDAQAYYDCAAAELRLGRYEEALRDCRQAIALNRDFAAAYNGRAWIYYRLKQYDKALADVKMFEKLGGSPSPGFLKALAAAAGWSK